MTQTSPSQPPKLVLVAGATGGVGQLILSELLAKKLPVRVLARDPAQARRMFADRADIIWGDLRDRSSLEPAMMGVSHIMACTGSTAFPTARWQFRSASDPWEWIKRYTNPSYCKAQADNSPDQVDAIGGQNLVDAAPADLQQFILVSACGVERKDQLPFSILNLFGVLDAKLAGETALRNSSLPYTILRPGRLIDGPYTSYDLNSLMQAKTEGKLGIVLGTGDRLSGETSRVDLAAAAVACLQNPQMINKVFEIMSKGPRPESINWDKLFDSLG
ncbi:MAG: SDR family oxidoreductase [Acaryochloridaceae cyanobacterium SU_2_1]|nr:SDR family oxidoreductase [Acaryochloridaceae cyanobacterium SU_2_1]NJM95373.1 SDR family oxidoreductase [Acaryochloridaceae cyanobacterium CSU_5_19]